MLFVNRRSSKIRIQALADTFSRRDFELSRSSEPKLTMNSEQRDAISSIFRLWLASIIQ